MIAYETFFEQVTGFPPYKYQKELAKGYPDVLQAETGAGKTAAVIVPWLWKHYTKQPAPIRLVIAEPMRTLTEQVTSEATKWVKSAQIDAQIVTLMGGLETQEWRLSLKPTILVGTIDMLLSRALGQGYAMPPRERQVDAGILNYDTHWVLDETQLMGVANETTAWLQHIRHPDNKTTTTWCSATTHPEQYAKWLGRKVTTIKSDVTTEDPRLQKRATATKQILTANKETAIKTILNTPPEQFIIVVANTVDSAVEWWNELVRTHPTTLLHSRFRPEDRQRIMNTVLSMGETGGILVSTQVIEAGVDLDANHIYTEACPYSSFVQRLGRCNRTGTKPNATATWIPTDNHLPYEKTDIEAAAAIVHTLTDGSPQTLSSKLVPPRPKLPQNFKALGRDFPKALSQTKLNGKPVNLDRYIRESSTSVSVCWRNPDNLMADSFPTRNELVSIPIGKLKQLELSAHKWEKDSFFSCNTSTASPGETWMLRTTDGHYNSQTGWENIKTQPVEAVTRPEKSIQQRYYSKNTYYPLNQHGLDAEQFASKRLLSHDEYLLMKYAAALHDIGKAHKIFQNALKSNIKNPPTHTIAKAPYRKTKTHPYKDRPKFRHELVSAYLYLNHIDKQHSEENQYLIAYLVAAHHGRISTQTNQNTWMDLIDHSLQPGDKIEATQHTEQTTVTYEGIQTLIQLLKTTQKWKPQEILATLPLEANVRLADWEASDLANETT